MLIFPMLLCHLKSETLKPWNFESCTSNFCCLSLPPLNLTFLMLTFPYHFVNTNLKPWNCKIFTSSFRCLSLPSELDISNVNISNVNISNVDISHVILSQSPLIIKNEMCSFEIQNVPFSKRFGILELRNWATKPSYAKRRHTSSY